MKKYVILYTGCTLLAISSCSKTSESVSLKPEISKYADDGEDETVILNTTIDADNTAYDIMMAIEASVQSSAVKIGNYGGGTDTAKKRWTDSIKEDIAGTLGITVEELEDMDGIDLLNALFPAITTQETDMIANGADIISIEYHATNSFAIHAGPSGSDVMNSPALILNFSIN